MKRLTMTTLVAILATFVIVGTTPVQAKATPVDQLYQIVQETELTIADVYGELNTVEFKCKQLDWWMGKMWGAYKLGYDTDAIREGVDRASDRLCTLKAMYNNCLDDLRDCRLNLVKAEREATRLANLGDEKAAEVLAAIHVCYGDLEAAEGLTEQCGLNLDEVRTSIEDLYALLP